MARSYQRRTPSGRVITVRAYNSRKANAQPAKARKARQRRLKQQGDRLEAGTKFGKGGKIVRDQNAQRTATRKRKQSGRPTQPKAKSGIKIKPGNQGKLRKAAGVKKGQKIPASKLAQMKRSKNPKTRKRATFAQNARKWKRG